MTKVITWVDLQGRYRITSPAYNDLKRPAGETEDECIERVWAKLVASGNYGIPLDHPRFAVEDADMRERVGDCCGLYFRYPQIDDAADLDENKEVKAEVIAKFGWEIDTDGRPKVNMTKARAIHMDCIRKVRNAELVKLDVPSLRAQEANDATEKTRIASEKQTLRDIPQTFDLSTHVAPKALHDAWPDGLPAQ
jgi:hypothetical protein